MGVCWLVLATSYENRLSIGAKTAIRRIFIPMGAAEAASAVLATLDIRSKNERH
jgi:hypothetical protein